MILQALHTTLNAVLPAYPLIGDIEATTPFCMYKTEPVPVRDKTGVIGHAHTVTVGIVDRTIASVNTYTELVVTAMLAMKGTMSTTIIESIIQIAESGIYLGGPQVYINDLEFRIYTTNR